MGNLGISIVDDETDYDSEVSGGSPTVIKVVGCGGGGSNAVNRMIFRELSNVDFIVLNTDLQALGRSKAPTKLAIGQKVTKGLGAGGKPEVGEQAAEEDKELITNELRGADMVFITAGMGGGTGTGSAPVVARIAKELGCLTVAVVTTPFEFEGNVRMTNAMDGLAKLRSNVDSLIVLPNDKIFKAMKPAGDRRLTFREQFVLADNLLCAGVKGVTEIITKPGEINVDFADVCAIMRGSGESILGVGKGKGENRINEAVEGAIFNPLLENRQIDGAKKILINITTNGNISLEETQEITDLIRHSADRNANIILGLATNENMEDDDLAVTVIATEFDASDNDFVTEAEIKEKEDKDDTVVSMEDFNNIIKGGLAPEAPVEKASEFRAPEPRYSTVGKNSMYDVIGSFETVKTVETPKAETTSSPSVFDGNVDETPAAPVSSGAGMGISSSYREEPYVGKEPPKNIRFDDPDVPPYWKNKAKLQHLNRSIDLTSE